MVVARSIGYNLARFDLKIIITLKKHNCFFVTLGEIYLFIYLYTFFIEGGPVSVVH
jgi:hypothetical protein